MPSTVTSTTSIRTRQDPSRHDQLVDRAPAASPPPRREGPSLVPTDAPGAGGRASAEAWVTKRQLAAHLQVTPRWIEMQYPYGLPHLRRERIVRYRISEVERWLRDGEQNGVVDAAQ